MTKEIYEKHEKDDRYRFFINKLAEQKNKEIESVIIADKERDNVQEYDPFLFKFEEEINNIINELNDDDNFFINISSGTPAMKNALVILQDLNEYNCKFIQVSTPIKKMNEHTHGKVLELELMWEMNMELEKEGNNRCVESKRFDRSTVIHRSNFHDRRRFTKPNRSLFTSRDGKFLALFGQ